MKDLFYMGGPLFMSILSILLLLMIAYSVVMTIALFSNGKDLLKLRSLLKHIRSIGLFSMVTGILGQLIGLYSAFSAIERAMDISPAIIAGGVKISMITTLYGIVIFLISLLIWFVLDQVAIRKS